MATERTQRAAIKIANIRHLGQIRDMAIAVAAANAATARVCPLGKLEPQYDSVSHNVGRVRPTNAFRTYTTITPLITEMASSRASKRRPAKRRASAMSVESGNRT